MYTPLPLLILGVLFLGTVLNFIYLRKQVCYYSIIDIHDQAGYLQSTT